MKNLVRTLMVVLTIFSAAFSTLANANTASITFASGSLPTHQQSYNQWFDLYDDDDPTLLVARLNAIMGRDHGWYAAFEVFAANDNVIDSVQSIVYYTAYGTFVNDRSIHPGPYLAGTFIGGVRFEGSMDCWGYFGAVALNYTPKVPVVPEPETYAMLLAGLGIMGMVVRRRHRSHRC